MPLCKAVYISAYIHGGAILVFAVRDPPANAVFDPSLPVALIDVSVGILQFPPALPQTIDDLAVVPRPVRPGELARALRLATNPLPRVAAAVFPFTPSPTMSPAVYPLPSVLCAVIIHDRPVGESIGLLSPRGSLLCRLLFL